MKDYVRFLQVNPRYGRAGVFTAKTYQEQAEALKAAGYATDPEYASMITSVAGKARQLFGNIKDVATSAGGSLAIFVASTLFFF